MENGTNNNAENEFFGSAPKPLEMSFVGACLGAIMQYQTDKNTGLTNVCMIIPTKSGYQPCTVTFGREDSVGTVAYEAFYHQLGLEKIIKSSKEDPSNKEGALETILNSFQKRFNLGLGNPYGDEILNDKMLKLSEAAKNAYPGDAYKSFSAVKEEYMEMFRQKYSSSKGQQKPENPPVSEQPEEKKTELKTTATTTQSWANA